MSITTHRYTIPPGRWLTSVRVVWVAVTLLAVTLFVVGLPMLYGEARTLQIFDVADRDEVHANLTELGLSVDFYAGYFVALGAAFAAACFALAIIIFARKSDEPIALFVGLALVLLGINFSGALEGPATLHPVLSGLINFLDSLNFGCPFLFFYLFPDGRFVPRWTRWLAVLLIVWVALMSFPDSLFNPENWPEEIS